MSGRTKLATVTASALLGVIIVMSPASAGGGCHTGVTEGHGMTVEMVEACFTPTVLSISPGETVTWVNRSGLVHNVTANLWGNFEDIADGDRVRMRFDDEGTYPYACTYHPGMSGVVIVGDGQGPGNGSKAVVTPVDGMGDIGAVDGQLPVTVSTPPNDGADWMIAGAAGLIAGASIGIVAANARRRWARPSAEGRPAAEG